jgi:16S rRNA processing protein RimM
MPIIMSTTTMSTTTAAVPPEFVEIGKIVAAHGIRGEVRVYPSSDFPQRFVKAGQRWLLRPHQSQPEPIRLTSGYYQEGKGLYVVRLEGVGDRNTAEALANCLLLVPVDDRPPLDRGDFLVADLLGMAVYEQANGALVGTVNNVIAAGNDLLEVIQEGRTQPIFIPFVMAIVPVVNLTDRRIEITPPPGLLDL